MRKRVTTTGTGPVPSSGDPPVIPDNPSADTGGAGQKQKQSAIAKRSKGKKNTSAPKALSKSAVASRARGSS